MVPVAVLNKPAPVTMDQFGISVAISGMRVVVGADRDDTGALNAGGALLYDLSGPDITVPAVIFNNPTPAVSEGFGRSVAISGTRVAIGAPCSLIGSQCAGSAYIYDVTGAVPALPVATLNNPGPAQDEFFGSSVGIDGTAIAIGTPNDGSQLPDSGIVYHYGPDSLDQDDDGLPDAWELTYWSTTAGHSAMDDFDHDGYGEILELAFGLNPVHPDPGGLPRVAIEDGYLTMTVTKHPGVTYEVQSAFTPLPDESLSFSPAQTRVLLDSPTTLKVRDHFLIRTVPSRYLRVKVTAAP